MNNKIIALVLTTISVITISVSSCRDKNTQFDYNQAIETVHDYVEVQQMTNLLLQTYLKAINDSLLFSDLNSVIDGAYVTLTTQPPTITFEYYNEAVDDGYGHIRSGRYIATANRDFTIPEAHINFDFINFSYDGDLIESQHFTITNNESNTNYSLETVDVTRTYGDTSGVIVYGCQQTISLIKDPKSQYHTNNDSLKISGILEGIARNGKVFNAVILESDKLVLYYSCNWLVDGLTEVQLVDFTYNAYVNFLNGNACQNKYSVITNGTYFEKSYDTNN